MIFKIPQNVDIDDKIMSFLSVKQLVILVIGFVINYIIFIIFQKLKLLGFPVYFIVGFFSIITLSIAFLKINFLPFHKFVIILIANIIIPQRRYWNNKYFGGLYFDILAEGDSLSYAKQDIKIDGKKDITNFEDIIEKLGEKKQKEDISQNKYFKLDKETIRDFSRFKI